MRGEGRLDQTLALQEIVRRHEDAHDEVEPEDRLAEGGPHGCADDLRTLAAQAHPGSARRLPGEPIEWPLHRRLGKLPADVGLEITEGMRLVEPA
jgi:hypothetical protein